MRCYKLAYNGTAGTGNGTLQILQSGRVRSVSISGFVTTVAATTLGAQIFVGANAIDESTVSLASPNNFAVAHTVVTAPAAAVGGGEFNYATDCDFPVTAGQNLVLNIKDTAIVGAAAGTYYVECFVWIG